MWDVMNRNTKKVIWALIILIVPAFCLFGVSSVLMGEKRNPAVGIIDGKKIRWQDYQKQYDSVLFMAHMMYRENFDKVRNYLDFNQQTWDRMLILKAIKDYGIKVSDKELIDFIQKFDAFKTDGKFDFQKYNDIITRGYRMPHTEFEAQMKSYLLIDKMKNLIADSAVFSEEEVLANYMKENRKRKASYVLFKAADYLKTVDVTEEEVASYFQAHKDEFKEPEKIKVKYIMQDYSTLEKDIEISDEEIQKQYEDNQRLYKQKDKVRPLSEVKDIIVKQLGYKKKAALAEKKIDDIYYALDAGKSFDEVADSSKLKVQETDFFSKGETIAQIGISMDFATLPFSMKIGEYSEPVRTSKGMAILMPIEKKEAHTPTLEESKKKVIEKVKLEKAGKEAKRRAEEAQAQLKEKVEKESFTVAEAEKILKLKLQTSSEFTKNSGYERGIMNFYKFREVTFSLKLNQVSKVIDDRDQYIVLIPTFETAPAVKDFEAEKEALLTRFKRMKESEVLSDWLDVLKKRYAFVDLTPKLKTVGTTR